MALWIVLSFYTGSPLKPEAFLPVGVPSAVDFDLKPALFSFQFNSI